MRVSPSLLRSLTPSLPPSLPTLCVVLGVFWWERVTSLSSSLPPSLPPSLHSVRGSRWPLLPGNGDQSMRCQAEQADRLDAPSLPPAAGTVCTSCLPSLPPSLPPLFFGGDLFFQGDYAGHLVSSSTHVPLPPFLPPSLPPTLGTPSTSSS